MFEVLNVWMFECFCPLIAKNFYGEKCMGLSPQRTKAGAHRYTLEYQKCSPLFSLSTLVMFNKAIKTFSSGCCLPVEITNAWCMGLVGAVQIHVCVVDHFQL